MVGVVGAGTMGAGIAQVAALAGHPVVIHDVQPAAAENAVRTAADGIRRMAKREATTPELADLAVPRLTAANGVADLSGLDPVTLAKSRASEL